MTLGASARNQGVHDVFGGTVCVRRSALDQVGTIQHVPTAAVTRREQRAATPSPIASRDDDASRSRGPFM